MKETDNDLAIEKEFLTKDEEIFRSCRCCFNGKCFDSPQTCTQPWPVGRVVSVWSYCLMLKDHYTPIFSCFFPFGSWSERTGFDNLRYQTLPLLIHWSVLDAWLSPTIPWAQSLTHHLSLRIHCLIELLPHRYSWFMRMLFTPSDT